MSIKIKNWAKLQHFKDRTPPWIKLYRDILDDPDWHELDGDTAKVLIGLWLIASEDDEKEGRLPEVRKLAFRLRVSEKQINQSLNKLSHWLIFDDINEISSRYQVDAPETETERETDKETEEKLPRNSALDVRDSLIGFDEFWSAYPRKVAKPQAIKAWKKLKPDEQTLAAMHSGLKSAKKSEQWIKDGGAYIPHPATWLNNRRWEDQQTQAQQHWMVEMFNKSKGDVIDADAKVLD